MWRLVLKLLVCVITWQKVREELGMFLQFLSSKLCSRCFLKHFSSLFGNLILIQAIAMLLEIGYRDIDT